MAVIFELNDICVNFEMNAIVNRSLKYKLGHLFKKNTKSEFHALSNVSLTINDGEHVGLIGRNGAGKSTLLRVLTKVIIPQSGFVFVTKERHIIPLLELGIGFHPDLSGRENCYLAGSLMGYSFSQISEKIDSIIKFSELDKFFDEPVKSYSSGMYARLAFSLATDIKPEVLLIDEVFGVGDEFFMQKCLVRMQNLLRSGTTSVFVSHDLDFLVEQCNRLIWLDRGKIVLDGEPLEVAEAYREHHGLS